MSQPPSSWSVLTEHSPDLVRAAAGVSAVEHSDWVRLLLGQSFARTRVLGRADAPSAVEYLVSGAPVAELPASDDAVLAEASEALGTCFNGLQDVLHFHRKRVTAIASNMVTGQDDASMPFEVVLKAYPLLMCVTVSDDPSDWIATDEGLYIVRWGLRGAGHRPLLQWTDAQLAAMRRRVFERARLRDGGGGASPDASVARAAVTVMRDGSGSEPKAAPQSPSATNAKPGATRSPTSVPSSVPPARSKRLDRFNIALLFVSAMCLVAAVVWVASNKSPIEQPAQQPGTAKGPGPSGNVAVAGSKQSAPLGPPTGVGAAGSSAQTPAGKPEELDRLRAESNRLQAQLAEVETERDGKSAEISQLKSALAAAKAQPPAVVVTPPKQEPDAESGKKMAEDIEALPLRLSNLGLEYMASWLDPARQSAPSDAPPSIRESQPDAGQSFADRLTSTYRDQLISRVKGEQKSLTSAESARLDPFGQPLPESVLKALRGVNTAAVYLPERCKLMSPDGAVPRIQADWFWLEKAQADVLRGAWPKASQPGAAGSVLLSSFYGCTFSQNDTSMVQVEAPSPNVGRLSKFRTKVFEAVSAGKSSPVWRDAVVWLSDLAACVAGTGNGDCEEKLPAALAVKVMIQFVKDLSSDSSQSAPPSLIKELASLGKLLADSKNSNEKPPSKVTKAINVIDRLKKDPDGTPKTSKATFCGVLAFDKGGLEPGVDSRPKVIPPAGSKFTCTGVARILVDTNPNNVVDIGKFNNGKFEPGDGSRQLEPTKHLGCAVICIADDAAKDPPPSK